MVYDAKAQKNNGLRDGEYQLDKIVELDEGFFESVDTEKSSRKPQNVSVAEEAKSNQK